MHGKGSNDQKDTKRHAAVKYTLEDQKAEFRRNTKV